jgi:ABC-2 type transport system permease protein
VEITAKISTRYRYAIILLKQLVKTDFKLRYQNSVLGYLWSLLKPLFLFAIMYTVFVKIIGVNYGVPHSGVYLLVGIVFWTFFAEMTGGSVASIVSKGDLLRKLNFPRYVIVLAGNFSALINLLLNMIIIAIFMAIDGVSINFHIVLVPFILAEILLLGVALSFFLSATFVKLRDIGYVWDIVLQALFYATPIVFPLKLAPVWAQKIVMLSPVSQTIQDLRYLIVSNQSPTISSIYGNQWIRIIPVLICICLFVFSALYFKNRSKFFAEEI